MSLISNIKKNITKNNNKIMLFIHFNNLIFSNFLIEYFQIFSSSNF